MLSIIRAGLIAAMLSLLAGCAGKDFVRPSSDTFKIGQTTYSQVVQQMGEPLKTGEVLKTQQPPAKSWWVEVRRTEPPTERECG